MPLGGRNSTQIMPESSEHNQQPDTAPVEDGVIDINVACPNCEYNLRGLHGPIVDCPECGLSSDVPELAARQWNKPWYRAPGFNTLSWPTVWMFVGWIVAGIVDNTVGLGAPSGLIFMLVGVIGWCLLMVRAYQVLGGFLGLVLALVIHALLIGYLVSLVGGFGMITWGILLVSNGEANGSVIFWWLLEFFILFAVFWGCRRTERAIAGVCIRHYLRRRPTG